MEEKSMISRFLRAGTCASLLGATLVAAPALADPPKAAYDVTITNLTSGQTFTPVLVAAHARGVRLFEPGQPASSEIEQLAEGGDTAPLKDTLLALGSAAVADVQTSAGLLGPGQSTTVRIEAGHQHRQLSLAGMLIPTNDNFVALLGIPLPRWGESETFAPAWDAGSEANDQSCAHIPGPRCGGEGYSPEPADGDEGFVHVSRGFHDLGVAADGEPEILAPAPYDWRNPVALVRVHRIR
jgi:hypothetical protein